jgi:hypothetical protein
LNQRKIIWENSIGGNPALRTAENELIYLNN